MSSVPFHAQLAVHIPDCKQASNGASCKEATAGGPGDNVDGLHGVKTTRWNLWSHRQSYFFPSNLLSPAWSAHRTACRRAPRIPVHTAALLFPREQLKTDIQTDFTDESTLSPHPGVLKDPVGDWPSPPRAERPAGTETWRCWRRSSSAARASWSPASEREKRGTGCSETGIAASPGVAHRKTATYLLLDVPHDDRAVAAGGGLRQRGQMMGVGEKSN